MFASQGDVEDLFHPMGKMEQKYSSKVLIGNWFEDRQRVRWGKEELTQEFTKPSNSTYRTDFVHFPFSAPDQTVKRSVMKKLEGLPKKFLFTCDEGPNNQNLVSEYDDHYNRHGNPVLPAFRRWSRHKNTWLPEKSDFPTLEPPTNYGLSGLLWKKWTQKEDGPMNSVYTVSYEKPPVSAYPIHQVRHRASTQKLSSSNGQCVSP
ncbi:PREDICTED: uncharacterized protein C1orf158 homolog [Crocodylus porosus]|uniref:uncharacterized protein C1orf158 homolog n=1 Tax=Crocodylus porosus TaxID=8502 RepID=UPI00093BFEF0|nr:PREDICTED: uncharacterized protein C1orf158 homolog [Crocodylus porosus]